MSNNKTPSYITKLLAPVAQKATGKRVWSIDLETVWLPFFTATNVQGDTYLPLDVLGAPIRLAYNKDGSVKFSQSGRPVTKVAKELGNHIRLVRENFVASLAGYAGQVIKDRPDDYGIVIEQAHKAGLPIVSQDTHNLNEAMAKAMEAAMEAPAPEVEAVNQPDAKRELVTV